MERILFALPTGISVVFCLVDSTNLFALLLHHADILGRPQLDKRYEPFRIARNPTGRS
jgi:hypothetical protein